jgi:hypothetical protein
VGGSALLLYYAGCGSIGTGVTCTAAVALTPINRKLQFVFTISGKLNSLQVNGEFDCRVVRLRLNKHRYRYIDHWPNRLAIFINDGELELVISGFNAFEPHLNGDRTRRVNNRTLPTKWRQRFLRCQFTCVISRRIAQCEYFDFQDNRSFLLDFAEAYNILWLIEKSNHCMV